MTKSNMLVCYNKGCGKEFDPSNNADDACQFHPGIPVFHDALKGWSCCNKKSTDFSTFLSLPGCVKAQHSNVKPVEPEKPKPDPEKVKEVIVVQAPKPIEPLPRPSNDEPLEDLPRIVATSLISALENLKLNTSNNQESDNLNVPIGTSCKNHGCQSSYQGDHSNLEKCCNHPGVAIFHEGMKYWSCCQRKTSDFDNFLNQAGCTESSHTWFKKESNDNVNCRHDFHQTGGYAIVTIFSKNPVPDESKIKANQTSLDISISFEGGSKSFKKQVNLFGIIDIKNSQVNYYASKVEIKLKKAEPISWKKLEFNE